MKMKTQHQNLWNAAKAVLKRKFIELSAYIEKKKDLKTVI